MLSLLTEKKLHAFLAFQWINVSSFWSSMVEIIKNTKKNSPVVFHKQHLLRIQQSRRQEKRNQPATFLLIFYDLFGIFKQNCPESENTWKLKWAQLDVLWNLQMIELRTQGLFVSLEWFAQSLFVSLGGFAHREKENVVWRFVFPCGGAAAKIIVKSDRRLAWNEIVMIIRFYESRLNSKDLLPFFLSDRFFFQILMEAGWKICALWSQLIKPHSTIDDALSWSTKVSNGSTSYFTT